MYDELRTALLNANRSSKSPKRDEWQGRAVDMLKDIEHFKQLDNQFGTEYVLMYLSLINLFILREGFGLMEQCDQFVLIEGNLHLEQSQFKSGHGVEVGKLFDTDLKEGYRYVARTDCKMIRIKRGLSVKNLLQKKIHDKEREQSRLMYDYQRLLANKQHLGKRELIAKISFFNCLGQFDISELAVKCEIRQYPQGAMTHEKGQDVKKIGCIVSGKLRLTFNDEKKSKDMRVRNHGMHVNIAEGDWIGLEEYLWDYQMKSSGEVHSVIALVVWIPCQLFRSKFNTRTNYQVINRLINLIQTKKTLFQRSFDSRKRKEEEISIEHEASSRETNHKLLQKISTLQLGGEKKKSHFRTAKNIKQIQIPERIMHRVNYMSQGGTSLPKLQQKVMLFPEQYQKSPVNMTLQKQLRRLEQNSKGNRSSEPKIQIASTIDSNPETLYKTIFSKIAYRFTARPKQLSPSIEKNNRLTLHYNQSIYNNFRVGKYLNNKQDGLKKFKTLTILTDASKIDSRVE